MQKLPDLPDWGLGNGDWTAGKETFDKYNNQVNISFMVAGVAPDLLFLGWTIIDG